MRPQTPFVYLGTFRVFKYASYVAENDRAILEFGGVHMSADLAVIEVDTSALDVTCLRPDEDLYNLRVGSLPRNAFASQVGIDWAKANPELWRDSLEVYGTVAYMGPIPVSAIKKVGILRVRPTCMLCGIVRSFNKITSTDHWLEMQPRQEAVMRAIVGEGISVEDLSTPEESVEREAKGLSPAQFQSLLDSASVIVLSPNGEGEFVQSFHGDHSMFVTAAP